MALTTPSRTVSVAPSPPVPAPIRPRVPSAPPTKRDRFSPQIQGLRAVAVLSVVLYHLWPDRLTGGFVGVDVFFVISGYLICGHLLRELTTTGTIRLRRFWARRIRRLLPAAFLVLATSLVFVIVAVPGLGWAQNLAEIRAAAAYFENWRLAGDAIDYLAAQNSPSLVQHFWSLSTEEQFYVLEPLLMLAVFAVVRRRSAVVALLCVVVVGSLTASIVLTAVDPGPAYFSTGTRAWEFAVGGLAAAVPMPRAVPAVMRAIAGWAGLALIAFAVVLYSKATPFPGWTAAVPVIGTALVLLCGDVPVRWSAGRALGLGPLTRIGDWSYAVYLWHWPLIVAVPIVLGRPSGWKVKVAIVVVAVVLAALTKRFVEDRWRRPPAGRRGLIGTYVAMALAVLLVGGVTTAASAWQAHRTALQSRSTLAALAAVGERCVGAGAVLHSCARPYAVTDTVVPAVAADDVPWNRGIAASQSCAGESVQSAPVAHACMFNDPAKPSSTVVLVGDSHADHLIDALNAAATERGWRFITYTREGCSGIPSSAEPDARCRTWSSTVQATLLARHDVDMVVFSNYASNEQWAVGDATSAWRALVAAGMKVVPLIDVPGMPAGVSAPACVARHSHEDDPCTTAVPAEGKTEKAARAAGLPAVGINDLLCRGGRCHAVIGGLIVYMDEAHMTLHFSYTLRDVLGTRIAAALAAERSS